MRRNHRIIVVCALAAGAIVAAVSAYNSQTLDREASFDSDLSDFLKRTDSALLRIVRYDTNDGAAMHLDEYSLANSDPVLYQHLSAVNVAHNREPATSMPRMANIEVVLSRAHANDILESIVQTHQDQSGDSEYQTFTEKIEVNDLHYQLSLMISN